MSTKKKFDLDILRSDDYFDEDAEVFGLSNIHQIESKFKEYCHEYSGKNKEKGVKSLRFDM